MQDIEFQRQPNTDNIFENNEQLTIVLRYDIGWESRYPGNQENQLTFEKVKDILQKSNTCYFQKNKVEEVKNRQTGKFEERTSHKIIVPYCDNRALIIIGSLSQRKVDEFENEFSYFMAKIKEAPFFKPPANNAIINSVSFKVLELKEQGDAKNNTSFKSLYQEIQKLEIPTIDINKEADKKIWGNYVSALKKLVKRKEQVWKIKNVSEPYYEQQKGKQRASFIDVSINEEDLLKQFEEEIINEIGNKKLEDWGVNKDNAFFELRNYSLLGSVTLDKIKSIGGEFFYELSEESPTHYQSGVFSFSYASEDSRTEIFENIESQLEEYSISETINEYGKININESDLKFLEKIIEDNYNDFIVLNTNNEISINVKLKIPNLENLKKTILDKIKLDYNRFSPKVSFDQNNSLFILEIGHFIENDILNEFNVKYLKTQYRVKPKGVQNLKKIVDIPIIEGYYQFEISHMKQLNPIVSKISKANNVSQKFNECNKRPTRYFFSYNNIEELKQFKLEIDNKELKFDIPTSSIKIAPKTKEEYLNLVSKVKQNKRVLAIEDKQFSPEYYIQFIDDLKNKRQSVLNRIQNSIKESFGKDVNLEIIGDFKKLLFNFTFSDDEERERLKTIIKECHKQFQNSTILEFDNELGRTVYEFVKNEELEANKEKEVIKGVRQATFIYLNEEEKSRYDKEKAKRGDDDRFRGGINIGRLIRKNGSKLKFILTDDFENLLNASEDKRLDVSEIKKGFIKPIFPGELVNIGRMITAMNKVTEPGGRNGYAVNLNLQNFIFDSREARNGEHNIEEIRESVLSNLIETNLNEKQIEAVIKSIASKDMTLIQGPPGTGKTTVIAEIIWQTLNNNPEAKILVTSQTNLAVDNAIERLSGKRIVRPIRIGNIDKFEDEGKIYSIDRIEEWINQKSKDEKNTSKSNNAINKWMELVSTNCSNDDKFKKAVDIWKEKISQDSGELKSSFYNSYKKHINIFAATCSECGSNRFRQTYQDVYGKNKEGNTPIEFDVVIMDEASKATPPELILPLTFGKKVIILGDHKQLPPMLDEKEFDEALESVGLKNLLESWTRNDYKTSQFEKLFKNAPKSIVASLDTQFRMHEQIMNCITQFYRDQDEFANGLVCGIKETMDIPDLKHKGSRWHGLINEPFINQKQHAIWVNVNNPESTIGTGTSYKNEGEIKAIKTVLNNLVKAEGFEEYQKSISKEEDKEIGIITFYMPQMQEIKKSLYPSLKKEQMRNFEHHKSQNEFNLPFRINTVDRFQGMEREILIISTVRSNSQLKEKDGKEIKVKNTKYPQALGFAREFQRINVGLSRAKRLLIVIGNQEHFSQRPEYAEAIRKMHVVDIKQLQNL